MKKSILYPIWGGMFILCAGLGFIPAPEGILATLSTAVSVLFFVPPGLLLYIAAKQGQRDEIKLIRNLSLVSLILTLVLLVANFSLALRSETLGTFLHYALTIVSAPMVASGHWAMSLFLWACLLMASVRELKKCRVS